MLVLALVSPFSQALCFPLVSGCCHFDVFTFLFVTGLILRSSQSRLLCFVRSGFTLGESTSRVLDDLRHWSRMLIQVSRQCHDFVVIQLDSMAETHSCLHDG